MSLSLRYGARSDVGLLRDGNEDAMYAGPRLLAVADGMGGHAAGEVASRVVIETVATLDAEPPDGDLTDALRVAVERANAYLREMVAADSALEGMGTTLTALLWVGQQLGLVHVGDSRGYLFRDGRLEPITHDHTLVQSLVDEGRISAEEATTHPQRSWITRALDGRPAIELDLSMRDARAGDRFLLCSDGLSSYVTEQTIAEALRLPDPQDACNQLVELALRAGGPDNVTCIVADLVEHDGSDNPIVGGAAADDGAAREAPDSPAARAAAIQPVDGHARAAPTPAGPTPAAPTPAAPTPAAPTQLSPSRRAEARHRDDDDEPRPSGGGSRRLILVLAGVLLLVVLGAVGTFLYVRTQFYVSATADTAPKVAVYRGVSGSLLGVDLSRLTERTDLPVTALPDFERPKVTSGIQATSESDARRIVTALRQEACARAATAAQPTPKPAPTRSASTKRRAKPIPAPTPSPTPSYCASAP